MLTRDIFQLCKMLSIRRIFFSVPVINLNFISYVPIADFERRRTTRRLSVSGSIVNFRLWCRCLFHSILINFNIVVMSFFLVKLSRDKSQIELDEELEDCDTSTLRDILPERNPRWAYLEIYWWLVVQSIDWLINCLFEGLFDWLLLFRSIEWRCISWFCVAGFIHKAMPVVCVLLLHDKWW